MIAKHYVNAGEDSIWEYIYTEKSDSRFYIEDETGRILVDPSKGDVDILFDMNKQEWITAEGAEKLLDYPCVREYAAKNPEFKKAINGYGKDKLLVTNEFIREGEEMYALGSAMPIEGASSTVSNENLVIMKNDVDGILYISHSDEKKIIEKMIPKVILGMFIGFVSFFLGLGGILIMILVWLMANAKGMLG